MARASLLRLLLLGGIWGMSFIFLRITAPVFGPLLTTFTRIACGAALLLLVLRMSGIRLQWRERLPFHLMVGFSNTALPFFLFSWAAVRTPSAYLATLNATAPVFVALFARLLTGERLSLGRLVGFAIGLVGVAVLVGLGPATVDGRLLSGVLAGLGAASCYGFAAVHVRRFSGGLAPLAVATGSSVAATLLLLPLALIVLTSQTPLALSMPAAELLRPAFAVLTLGFVCTGFAYALYFRLLADEGPARAATVTFLVPLAATVWSIVLLNEHVTPAALIGMALVLTGTAFSLGLVDPLRLLAAAGWRSLPRAP